MNTRNNVYYTYLIIAVLIIAIISSLTFKFPLYNAIFIGLVATIIIALILGNPLIKALSLALSGVRKASVVLIVMSIVGILISMWMLSGTIPTMIYYGLQYLSTTNIILAAFIISAGVSMVLGTAIGTLSTIGSVFLSLSYALNVPLGPLVGALVSGAYLGDRTSPMSSSANLLASTTDTELRDNIIELLKSSVPVFIVSMALYWVVGREYILTGADNLEKIMYYQGLLTGNYNIGIITLIPPAVILLSTLIFKQPIVKTLMYGVISSIMVMIIQGGFNLSSVLAISIYGYHPTNPEISSILSGGGLLAMRTVLLVVTYSTALTGILQGLSLIDPIIDNLKGRINSKASLHLSTILTTVISCFITCSQALTIIIPAQYLKDIYDEYNMSRLHLVRTIADTGIIIVAIVPWNLNALMVSSLLKVEPIEYIPYSFMCTLLPLTAVLFNLYIRRRSVNEN